MLKNYLVSCSNVSQRKSCGEKAKENLQTGGGQPEAAGEAGGGAGEGGGGECEGGGGKVGKGDACRSQTESGDRSCHPETGKLDL